jgi:hypothetical protein
MAMVRFAVLVAAGLSMAGGALASSFVMPENPGDFAEPVPFAALEEILAEADKAPHVSVTKEGESVEGRPLLLARIGHAEDQDPWRIFLIGLQHGNEPAGRDALAWMIRDYARHPEKLPRGVELYILPNINPDGGEKNQRRNANGIDLNRDHVELSQPETVTLHRIQRRLMPHVTVDCHEFGRDTSDYVAQGWLEWPLIMMDTAAHPLFPEPLVRAGERWVDDVAPVMEAAGFNYCRYFVGDAPPGEMRWSHPELGDARNTLGTYLGLSFIIESGIFRQAENQNADLGERVAAYVLLLRQFIENDQHRGADRAVIEAARAARLPRFLPTNYFWASVGLRERQVPVILKETGETRFVPTASLMDTLVVKTVVPTPRAYLIRPAQAELYAAWLGLHGVAFEVLDMPQTMRLQPARQVRFEEEDDDVYGRYSNRTINALEPIVEGEAEAGSLLVPLEGLQAFRAAIMLEPAQVFGLGQYKSFQVPAPDWPVVRVMD